MDKNKKNLEIVQKYISTIEDKELYYLRTTCSVCDSDLPMLPQVDEEGRVLLFCLTPKCNFKFLLGQGTIDGYEKWLTGDRIPPLSLPL